jgi:FixJ family two-component response regulator
VALTSLVAIVDDDESVRLATENLVRSLGHMPVTFSSAEAFLDSPCLERVECLITDIRMPGMTGVQLQHTLLAQHRNLPIIFMTGYPDARAGEKVLAAGAVGVLQKPFEGAEIVRCLTVALNRSGAQQN